jgi:tetratricopeptide (TPR) repeat protein
MNRFSKCLCVVMLGLYLAACAGMHRGPGRVNTTEQSKAVAVEKSSPEDTFNEALSQMNMGNTDQAVQLFIALTEQNPFYSGPWTNLGIIYAQAGQYNEAGDAFIKAVRANSRNIVAMNWLGYLAAKQRSYEEARRWYEQILSIRPDYTLARLNLAVLYDTALHSPHQALEQYRRYRDQSDEENLVLDVWIKELELEEPPVTNISAGISQ